jgi:alpha-L-fucosidase
MRHGRVILVGCLWVGTWGGTGCNTTDAMLGSGPGTKADASAAAMPPDGGNPVSEGGADGAAEAGSAEGSLEAANDAEGSTVENELEGGNDADSGTDADMSTDSSLIMSDSTLCVSPDCTVSSLSELASAHSVPTWLAGAKLGIGMHFIVATVPAYQSADFFSQEYCNSAIALWTSRNFPTTSPLSGGPWGYKDFIPLFTVAQWSQPAAAGAATNAASWAALFKASGATFVNATAQFTDRFAMWDSAEPATVGGAGRWNATQMGPKRDVVGELRTAVHALGLKFGVNNHIMYGYSVAYCGDGTVPGDVGPDTPASVSDLYDPNYASFYGPPSPGCGVGSADGQCNPEKSFCDDWLYRSEELVDKYELDDMWFDWDGATVANSPCMVDKLIFAIHYYETTAARGQTEQIMSRGGVFPDMSNAANGANVSMQDLAESILPSGSAVPSAPWLRDEDVSANGSGSYIDPMTYKSSAQIITDLDAVNAVGGTMFLNISPMLDGTIPPEQVAILNAVGKHLGAQ